MKNKNSLAVQKMIDGFIDKTILRFIPHRVKPNYVTIVRFILVPVVYMLLVSNKLGLGLAVFIIAASTDFIDGAMARTRNQITDIGKVIDPVADKLLILSVFFYVGFNYLIVKIFVIFIVLELIAVILGAVFSFVIGRPIGANIFGKVKMILQSFSVGFFILGISIGSSFLVNTSEKLLFIALFFAVLSAVENVRIKIVGFKA